MEQTRVVATAAVAEWQPMETAPINSKCLLLTTWGIAVIGLASQVTARDGTPGYLAWSPLPKMPQWLRDLRRRYEFPHEETPGVEAAT